MTRTLLAGLLILVAGAAAAQAQSLEELRGAAGAFYTFADPTDITIEVKVWGAVQNAGLYEVRQGLPLSTLLTLAGGPAASVRDTGTSSTLTVRLYRPQPEGYPALFFEARMQNEILMLEQDPTLLHGDVLVVEEVRRQRFNWLDALSVVTAAGTLVLVIERVASLGK